jgi:hypothetical protein
MRLAAVVKSRLPGGAPNVNVVCEVNVLRSIDFIQEGRRYRAVVGPVPGGAPEFAEGAWFVSMNGGPQRRVFEAHRDDADTAEFRHRIVIATWLTDTYDRRVSGERRKAGRRNSWAHDRRAGPDRRA